MRKLLFLLAFILGTTSLAQAQWSTISAFTASAFAKATTREDTSATITIGSYPYVATHITTTGTDSAVIYMNFDAYINGLWVNNIIRDTVNLGRPTGHILAGSAKGQVDYNYLRHPATNPDVLGGAVYLRVRNKFSSGAGDSNAATTYTQKLILRKVQ